MRTVIWTCCFGLALIGQQKPSDPYASAIAKYVAGDADAAFHALSQVSQTDIQKELEAIVVSIRQGGGSTASRRHLEAIAMLHTDYALSGGIEPKDVNFQIDMARLAMSVARLTLAGKDPARLTQGTDRENGIVTSVETSRAREFVPRWCALAASAELTYGSDTPALSLVTEGLKLLPDNEDLLFWRGVVLEFQAVWVGEPVTNARTYSGPPLGQTDGSGFDMVGNVRLWAPVESAYRRALVHEPDSAEAHLHLGYALYSLRNYRPAETEYELARDTATDPFVVYVADLLLARTKEDQNDPAGAARDYEHALAKMPAAQSAYIGLAMLEARRGNTQRARELTLTLAAIPQRQRVRDPWWEYHTTRIPERDLDWLRKAVRQ